VVRTGDGNIILLLVLQQSFQCNSIDNWMRGVFGGSKGCVVYLEGRRIVGWLRACELTLETAPTAVMGVEP